MKPDKLNHFRVGGSLQQKLRRKPTLCIISSKLKLSAFAKSLPPFLSLTSSCLSRTVVHVIDFTADSFIPQFKGQIADG